MQLPNARWNGQGHCGSSACGAAVYEMPLQLDFGRSVATAVVVTYGAWIQVMGRAIRSAPLLALTLGCARYEYVNELDVRGLCPGAARGPAPAPLRLEPTPDAAIGASLRARVIAANDGTGLQGAQVRLSDGARPAEVVTDSAGWFALDSLAAGRYEVLTRRIGFAARRDSLTWPLPERGSLLIPLTPQVLDGPCSGFAVVAVRQPWWKLW